MTVPRGSDGGEPEKSTRELAADARAALTQLHKDVVIAEERVVTTAAAELLEANEKLVVATLRAQSDAEIAAIKLEAAARASALDVLTGLPNRALLRERFDQALVRARRDTTSLALLFLDLDDFKQINDMLGHAVGDEALQQTARCLVSAIREGDTVSRHGGDEFLILLSEVTHGSDAIGVAEKVIASLSSPMRVGDHVIHVRASIGISIYPDHGADADALIACADAAMYAAKRLGRGEIVVHDETCEMSVPTGSGA